MQPISIWRALGCLTVNLLLGTAPLLGGETPGQPARQSRHGHMPLSTTSLDQWETDRAKAPIAVPGPARTATGSGQTPATPGIVNFLSEVSTVGALRDQGGNGNCWVWAPCAMAEVALKEQYGYKDSLSVQYIDSLMTADNWANGGTLKAFCNYVNGTGLLVPWANANAAYVDGITNGLVSQSLTPTATIQQSPAYTHVTVQGSTVPTLPLFGVSQAAAIANIKSLLDQHRAVSFGFITQFGCSGGFDDWWENNPESTLWPEPVAGPAGPPDGCWGAHMVTLVGYDESDPSPANHCWIVLNSWGVSANRPNGLFRIPMQMNYDAHFNMNGKGYWNYTFETLTLSADHPAATVPTLTVVPSTNLAKLGQPLTFTATTAGYPPFTYQWRRDGQAILGATSAAYTLTYLMASDGGRAFDVVVSNAVAGSPVATPSPMEVVPSLAGQQQLLLNPGFEDGTAQSAWAVTEDPYYSGATGFRNDPALSRSGGWYAFLGFSNYLNYFQGAYDQALTLPSGPGSVQLSYWMTAATGVFFGPGYAGLQLSIKDAATGQLLRTGRVHRNLELAAMLWSQELFGLSDLKGRHVTIHLEGYTSLSQWRLDDFAVTVDPADTRPLPVITAFSPTLGNPLDAVVLTGSGFTGATLIQFNGLSAPFTVISDTQITTAVPKNDPYGYGGDTVVSGPITVSTPIGAAVSLGSFQVLRPLILSRAPASALRGAAVVLTGSGFTGTTSVAFDGVAGRALVPASFQVNSDTQITTTVPVDAITGNIQVTNPYGTSFTTLSVLPSGPVSVVISPRPLAVFAGSDLTFTATVTGDIDHRVLWNNLYTSQQRYSNFSTETNPFTLTLDPTAGTLTLAVYWPMSPGGVTDTLTIPIKSLDFLGTGTVDVLDMAELARAYGAKTGDATFNALADLDGNGVIDDSDVSLFLSHF